MSVFWGCENSKNDSNLTPNMVLDAQTLASDRDFREYAILHNTITGQSEFLKRGNSKNRNGVIKEMRDLQFVFNREKNKGFVSSEIQLRTAKVFGFTNVKDMNNDFKSLTEKKNLLVQKYPSLTEAKNRDLLIEAYKKVQKELPYIVIFNKKEGYFALNKVEWRHSINNYTTLQTRCCPEPWDIDCDNNGVPDCGSGTNGCPENLCCTRAMAKLQAKYARCDAEFFAASFVCLIGALALAECPPCAILFAADCEIIAGMVYDTCLQDATAEYEYDIVPCGICL
jgi:hypothetical protein